MFIRVDYKLEADEFARGALAAFRRRTRTSQLMGVICGVLLAAVYAASAAMHLSPPSLGPSILVSAAALYLVLLPRIRGVVLRRRHRQRRVENVSVILTEEGVTSHVLAQGRDHRSVRGWASYVEIRETPEFFLLYPTRKRVSVVPKRAFTPDEADLFSRFVEHGFADARRSQLKVQASRS